LGGAEGARTPDPKTARSLRGKKTRIVATLWCAFRSRTWQEAQPSRNRLGGRASLRRPPLTHSFAQATPEIGGPGNKNKNSASSGRTLKRSESTGGESQPDATPVGYDLGGSSDSLLVGRCQPNQKSANHMDPVDRLLEEARLLLVPCRSAGGGPRGEDGLAATLALQATRINGRCPPPNHCSPADRRLGMVEIEFGAFLAGRHQDGGSAGARHPHGRFAVQTLT